MLESLKVRGHRWIAKKRRSRAIHAVHRLAAFFEDAYENSEWDMAANGELTLVRRLANARFTTIADVGAHLGDWSVAALSVWPAAHVHAFEVAPPTCQRLAAHVDAARFSGRVTLNCAGLSDAAGRRQMYFYPDHPQLTSGSRRHDSYRSTPFDAELLQGDAYLADKGIETIDFMKIDVEGNEHLVLKGLRRTIDEGRLHCIQFEYGAFSIDTRVLLADYYQMLGSRYWIGKVYPTYVDFSDYHWTMESFRFSNYLCVARARQDLKLLAERPA